MSPKSGGIREPEVHAAALCSDTPAENRIHVRVIDMYFNRNYASSIVDIHVYTCMIVFAGATLAAKISGRRGT